MNLAGGDRAELLLEGRFAADDKKSKDRLEALSSEISSKHRGRVTVQLQEKATTAGTSNSNNGSEGVSTLRLVRAGLVLDEYRMHTGDGDVPHKEELYRRVEAAISLSRPEDSSTLKGLWPADTTTPEGGDFRDEMAVATYAVQVASTVARELQEELCKQGAISKSDSSPVTVADFSVQAVVLGLLSRYFPGHGFIAEEVSSVLRQDPASLSAVLGVVRKVMGLDLTEADLCAAIDLGARGHGDKREGGCGGRTWVLDPIDGTKGFLRGEQFCVALGLLDGGEAVAGILGCPNLPADEHHQHPVEDSLGGKGNEKHRGLLYTATIREGTFVRALSARRGGKTRVLVDQARRPSETRVLESAESAHSSHAVAAQVCSDLKIELPPIRIDSQCKYGLLSQGKGGVYLRLPRWGYVENIWDHVAGAVVIQEAGGKVTDSRGEPLDFSLGAKLPREVVGVVATSGEIHAEVVRAVYKRQIQDWARVVAEAKAEGDDPALRLPGIKWPIYRGDFDDAAPTEGWTSALNQQQQPLVMRTNDQLNCVLERAWDKLVAVLFHGGLTHAESQHAMENFEGFADQRQQQQPERSQGYLSSSGPVSSSPPLPLPNSPEEFSSPQDFSVQSGTPESRREGNSSGAASVESAVVDGGDMFPVVLVCADVVSLPGIADRQRAIGKLPSLRLYLGGREIAKLEVNQGESAESLGGRIEEKASIISSAGR